MLCTVIFYPSAYNPDPIKAASQQERMEEARRRLQEKQDAKAAKFIEDKMQVSKPHIMGRLHCK